MFMSKPYLLTLIAFTAFFSLLSHGDSVQSLGGVKGKYSDWIDQLLQSKAYLSLVKDPTLPATRDDQDPVSVSCLETPGNRFHIGVIQNMVVHAPLQNLAKVVEDIDSYVDLFPGYASVQVKSREGNRLVTYWEQKIPVFFIPNVRFEMIYQLGLAGADPDTRIYRYELLKKGNLRESDGFIVLRKINDNETRYLEVDFFDADWGALETFAPGRIWTDSVDGLYLSDLGFLLKAEHPDWSNRRCREEADKTVDKMKKKPGERCVAAKADSWKHISSLIPMPQASPSPSNPSPSPSN
jgi:hypothetical protein